MKKNYVFIIFTFIAAMSAFGSGSYSERYKELTADSIYINSIADSIRSAYVRDEIKALFNKISESRKIFQPYSIDVYKREKFKYILSYKTEMTIIDLLDSLSEVIGKAKILRVNKQDLDNGNGNTNGNGKKIALSDNSFKDLQKEPQYKDKKKILELIEKTALTSFQKSSLEWIWGKSPESDAYFSTKLTFFDDHFSLYPEYRFFIGNDPFRDPKSWFFTLEDYSPQIAPLPVIAEIRTEEIKTEEKSVAVEEVKKEPEAEEAKINEVKEVVVSEPVKTVEIPAVAEPQEPPFDCGGSDEITDFTMVAVFYEKDQTGALQPVNRTFKAEDLLKELFKTGKVKFIRLTGSDYLFEGSEVRQSNSESVIEVSGDISICTNRLKRFLSEGISEPNKKRSIELITTANKDKLSYNAAVITVYDGQTTVFYEYKVYASSEVRKDKNSWFNRL